VGGFIHLLPLLPGGPNISVMKQKAFLQKLQDADGKKNRRQYPAKNRKQLHEHSSPVLKL